MVLSIQDLYTEWRKCERCDLHRKRKQVVFGSGNHVDPKIVIFGEAPGPEEDNQGIPFIGTTGKLLRRTLEQVGIDHNKECYITNSVLCFPTTNGKDFRGPTGSEILACRPRLEAELSAIAPSVKVILTLGKRAYASLLKKEQIDAGLFEVDAAWNLIKMDKILGWHDGVVPIYSTYHPSFIARSGANIASLLYIHWKKDLAAVKEFITTGQKIVIRK